MNDVYYHPGLEQLILITDDVPAIGAYIALYGDNPLQWFSVFVEDLYYVGVL